MLYVIINHNIIVI